MKRHPALEILDRSVGPWADAVAARRNQFMAITNRYRPLTTEADMIAAAGHRGAVTIQPMVMLKSEEICGEDCAWCRDWDAEDWAGIAQDQHHELVAHGVEWDPTIRF